MTAFVNDSVVPVPPAYQHDRRPVNACRISVCCSADSESIFKRAACHVRHGTGMRTNVWRHNGWVACCHNRHDGILQPATNMHARLRTPVK